MEDSETVVCRLCLNITTDDEYQLLDNISKDMIKFIVPEVDLEISRDPKICQTCYKTVLRCYRFKTNCKKEVKTDMKRDLGKGETAISVHIEELEKKCNFCSNNIDNDSVEDVSARKTYFTDVLQRCLPEWNLNSDTIPCKSCIDTLTNQYMFIGNCVDTEDKLRQYRLTSGTNNEEKLNLYEAVQQLLGRQCKDSSSMTEIDEFPKTGGENLPFPEVDANAEREIKMETIDIKSEISEMPEDRSPSTSKSVIPNISESKEGNGSLKMSSTDSADEADANPPKKRQKRNRPIAKRNEVVLHALETEVILYAYNTEVSKNPGTSFTNILKKVAKDTGKCIGTVRKILEKNKTTEAPSIPKSVQNRKTTLNDSDKTAIRRKLHQFFFRNESPTSSMLLQAVNEDPNLPNFKAPTFSKLLKKLKLKLYKGKQNNLVVDRDDVRCWRRNYLTTIKRYRNENHKIYYIGQTWVEMEQSDSIGLKNRPVSGKRNGFTICHIGSEDGFVPGAQWILESKGSGQYQAEMDNASFEKWFSNIFPKLEPNSVIVIDGTPSQSRKVEKIPTYFATTKADMQKWLQTKNIPFRGTMVKAQLMRLVNENKKLYDKYVIDELAKAGGKIVLRLPPHHTELNPIELVWAEVKHLVARKSALLLSGDVKSLCQEAMLHITPDRWKNCLQHVQRDAELKMWQIDDIMDEAVERLDTELDGDSSISSDMDLEC